MKYILYCRKSQESEDRQIQSLDAQERELREKALLLGAEIVAVYHESQSAKTLGRPIFKEVMRQIQEGKADGLLCWKLDRLARNFVDGGLVIELLQTGVLKSIQTYEKEYLPSDNVLTLAVELGMANQYSRDLSENVKRGNRQKVHEGGYPSKAPFGYINNKAEKTIEIDPVRGVFVSRMFELYATGLYSFRDLSKLFYEEGLRTRAGKKVYKSVIERIIRSSFYYGAILYKGKHYPAKHQALVSKDLFDKCQAVLTGKARPRKKHNLFPLTGLFTCGNCGCSITAQIQKGHTYYHCTNGKGNCDQKRLYTREEKLEEQFVSIFDEIAFDEELVEIMYQSALERIQNEHSFDTELIAHTERELTLLKERENRLLDAYLAQSIDKEVYESKQEEFKKDRIALTRKMHDLKNNPSDPYATIERTKEVFLAGTRAKLEYCDALPERKREIAFELLSNASLRDRNMANPQLKSPYDMLARTPKNADFSLMCAH